MNGQPMRAGRLFRSASLDSVTEDGMQALEDLGVRTVIDLRSQVELDRNGRFPYERSPVRWIHIPSAVGPPVGSRMPPAEMLDDPDPMRLIYRRLVTEGSPGCDPHHLARS